MHRLTQPARDFGLLGCWLIFLIAGNDALFSQPVEPRLQFSAQAGPVVFDELYNFHHTGRFAITGAIRVSKNLHALLRGGFIPVRQFFSTPVGVRDADIDLYELVIGAKLQAPKFLSSRFQPFFSLMGGVLLYRPKSVIVPIGLVNVKIDPPDATKPLLSTAVGIDWKLTKAIGLSLGFEASASRIAERSIDGTARERWRPFYSAAVGISGRIK